MEINIKLFKQDQLKLLLFVLRDFDQDYNFNQYQEAIRKNVVKIWHEIDKPKDMQEVELDSVFALKFYKLSNYKHANQDFLNESQQMRELFGSS